MADKGAEEEKARTEDEEENEGRGRAQAEVEAKLIESLSEEDWRELDAMEQEGRKGANRITCLPPWSKTRFQHRCRSGLPTARTATGS